MRLDKSIIKPFAVLTVSLALQNLLSYSVNLMDNVMLGAHSEMALSGAALCNQYQFLLQMLVLGAGEGVVVLGSQYWGKGEIQPIYSIMGIAMRYTIIMSSIMSILAFFFPMQMLGVLTNDAAVVAEGAKYLKIICFSYLLFAVTNTLTASLRAVGNVKIGYYTAASTLCINVFLNYALIYGKLGLPMLGIRGAAIATLVARVVELLIVCLYVRYGERLLRLDYKKLLHIDTSYYKDYRKVALPVLLNQGQWGIAQMVQTAILGHMGAAAIAANSIATIVFQIISVLVYGSASASSVLVGKTVGSGDMPKLRSMVRTLQWMYIIISLLTGGLIYLARTPVLMFYNISEEARNLAWQFMTILAITSMGTAYQVPCDNGIIRGGGDTSFSMKMNLISMWLIVVPLSAFASFQKYPAIVVFFLLKWDQLYKIIPVKIRLNSWKWVRRVTRGDDAALPQEAMQAQAQQE